MRGVRATVLLLALGGAVAQAQAPVPANLAAVSFRVGDAWLFRHYDVDPHKAFRITQLVVKAVDDQTVRWVESRIDVPGPPEEGEWKVGQEPLPFPVFVGKTWSSPIKRKGQVVGKSQMSASRLEMVSTPAGDFDTIVIDDEFTIPEGSFHQRLWWSPEARTFVKISYLDTHGKSTQTRELLWYRLQRAP